MAEQKMEGGCLCGAVRYEITGKPVMTAICHCTLCRRAAAAPSMAWAMFRKNQVTFSGGQPSTYVSSTVGRRGFCPSCGTQISFTASYIPGLIDITVGSLDQPDQVRPTLHYWGTRRVPWVQYAYSTPRIAEQELAEEVEG
jgi:hypothetical protein